MEQPPTFPTKILLITVPGEKEALDSLAPQKLSLPILLEANLRHHISFVKISLCVKLVFNILLERRGNFDIFKEAWVYGRK